MRILIPTADYPPIEGGISTVTLEVSRELAALGHAVTVIAPRFPGQDEFDKAEPAEVIRYRGYGLGWFRFFPMLWATWPHVRSCDLILGINVAYGGVFGLFAKLLFKKPYGTFAYAYEFLKFRRVPLAGALLRAVYRRARAVIAISQFTRDNLIAFGAPPENIHTILPGAPAARAHSPEEIRDIRYRYVLDEDRVILAVGRLIPRKGQVTLVQALPRILERFPDTVLIIVGRGPCIDSICDTANELGVRNNVVLPGRLSDAEVAALYATCDVFALPTGVDACGQVEGFGLVFTEAHAYGKPVVAGRSGGVPEAVLDAETGLLVEPEDPQATAGAIVRLFEDSDLAARLGEVGKARVESELNWHVFTQRVMDALGDT